MIILNDNNQYVDTTKFTYVEIQGPSGSKKLVGVNLSPAYSVDISPVVSNTNIVKYMNAYIQATIAGLPYLDFNEV